LTSGHSDPQGWASGCQDVKNYKWRLNPLRHGMLFRAISNCPFISVLSCTHTATVGVKGLMSTNVSDLDGVQREERMRCQERRLSMTDLLLDWIRFQSTEIGADSLKEGG